MTQVTCSQWEADYSSFPFENFTVKEIFALAVESKDLGDEPFVKACMEAIRTKRHLPEDQNDSGNLHAMR